jgi:hypothetical protein
MLTTSQLEGVKMIERLTHLKRENPIILRDLESNVYILKGYIIPFKNSSSVYAAQTPLLVTVVKSSKISFIQAFYPINNMLQYFEIKDDEYKERSLSLNDVLKIKEIK